jgi:hypothetical protein
MKLLVLLTSGGITITDGKSSPIHIAESHPMFKLVLSLVEKEETTIQDVLNVTDIKSKLQYSDDHLEIYFEKGDDEDHCDQNVANSDEYEEYSDLVVKIDGKTIDKLPKSIERRIVATMKETNNDSVKFNFKIFGKFLSRLYQNPSFTVVNQLYRFMEHNNLPITQNGTFLAYKKVDYDYKDLHSHTIDNSIGQIPSLTRNLVEDNPDITCSAGLHVCSKDYLPYYGSNTPLVNRVMVVEVDPVDVESVPRDYNNAKMRVCKYSVVDELTDFDVSLGSFYFGKHEKGWVNKTLASIKDFYVEFWKLGSSDSFNWDFIPKRDGYWNNSVLALFIDTVKSEFGPIFSEQEEKDFDNIEHIAYHPLELFSLLSYHDTSAFDKLGEKTDTDKDTDTDTDIGVGVSF